MLLLLNFLPVFRQTWDLDLFHLRKYNFSSVNPISYFLERISNFSHIYLRCCVKTVCNPKLERITLNKMNASDQHILRNKSTLNYIFKNIIITILAMHM